MTAPNPHLVVATGKAFDSSFDIIRGMSEYSFSIWTNTPMYINAYRYAMLRSGRIYEVRIMPSEHQSKLSCQWIACLRVAARALGIDLDAGVRLLETRGKALIGELGFVFRLVQSKHSSADLRGMKFHVDLTPLELCSIDGIERQLPVITQQMIFRVKQSADLLDLSSDQEVWQILDVVFSIRTSHIFSYNLTPAHSDSILHGRTTNEKPAPTYLPVFRSCAGWASGLGREF